MTGFTKPEATLKDQNFLEAIRVFPNLTKVHPMKRDELVKAMRRDTKFLRDNNLMDYSLLVGIEKGAGSDWSGINERDNSVLSESLDKPEEVESKFAF